MARKPPRDFDCYEPLITEVPGGSLWVRSHLLAYSPVYFGRTRSQRWGAPAGEYGALYVGEDAECAFLESIGRGLLRTRLVPERMLLERGYSELVAKRALRVIDLVISLRSRAV